MSSQKEALGALVSIQALKPGRYLDGRPLGTPGAAGMGSDMELTGLLKSALSPLVVVQCWCPSQTKVYKTIANTSSYNKAGHLSGRYNSSKAATLPTYLNAHPVM